MFNSQYSMVNRTRGFWFLTLFAAEEIPAAMVTYVALLMLLQLGVAPAAATVFSALLFIPWVLKSFMRSWVRRVGNFKQMLHLIEVLLFIVLVVLAFSFNHGPVTVFVALFFVSLLCAWHELAARMYYERMLLPAYQRLLTAPKLACSQVAIIFTYGALIFLVGTLQVYFRQIRYSWSMGCYVAAGLFLIFTIHHFIWLKSPRVGDGGDNHSLGASVKAELRIIDRIRHQKRWWHPVLILFLLLLPQGLMFHARVLYLYMSESQGGLQCTMQEIGFAQGTVGVIAFSVGLFIGRRLIQNYSLLRLFWSMSISIVLSPFVYLCMTVWPPQTLWMLCCCTMTAQFLFGLGLSICRLPISIISGARYRNTINMLQIPLVSAAMIVPMAISGWLVEQMGFSSYFIMNALSAPFCLLGILLLKHRGNPLTL
jgi:PAT family beta-lactamase induction signal transducer AmpG